MRTCIDCGRDYPYISTDPKGASADRCCPCRKKDSAKNKKLALLEIASPDRMECRKCGFDYVFALNLVNGKEFIGTLPAPKELAKTQFILCHNCLEQVKRGDVEFKADTKTYPVSVEFYETRVRVVKVEIPTRKFTTPTLEVTDDLPNMRNVTSTKHLNG